MRDHVEIRLVRSGAPSLTTRQRTHRTCPRPAERGPVKASSILLLSVASPGRARLSAKPSPATGTPAGCGGSASVDRPCNRWPLLSFNRFLVSNWKARGSECASSAADGEALAIVPELRVSRLYSTMPRQFAAREGLFSTEAVQLHALEASTSVRHLCEAQWPVPRARKLPPLPPCIVQLQFGQSTCPPPSSTISRGFRLIIGLRCSIGRTEAFCQSAQLSRFVLQALLHPRGFRSPQRRLRSQSR